MKEVLIFILLSAYICLQVYMGFYADDITYFIADQYCYIILLIVAYLRPLHFINLLYISVILILSGCELWQEYNRENKLYQAADYLNLLFGSLAFIYAIIRKNRERTNNRHT